MSEHYENRDEMAPTELTDADWEADLSRRAPDGVGSEELARFVGEVRALYAKRVDEPIEQAQLDAIVEAAERTLTQDQGRTSLARQREASSKRRMTMPRKRLVLLVAAAAFAVVLLAAGLAAAGVSLPGVLRAPLDRLGIQPPNEASADSIAREIDFAPPDQGMCSFAQPIAAAANVGGQGTAGGLCSREDVNGGGEAALGDSTGRLLSQSPLESARRSAPPQEQGFGDQTSPASQGLAQEIPPAAKGPDQGQQVDQEQSQSGQGIGQGQPQGNQIGQPSYTPDVGEQGPQAAQPIGQGQPQGNQIGQPSSAPDVGGQGAQAAQPIGQGQPQGNQIGQPSSAAEIGQTSQQAGGAGL